MASTTVNFNLKTAGYVNYANQTLTFRLLTAGAEASTGDQSYVTLPGVVTATSAANGDGSVSLFRNGKSGIESVYEVILPNREKAKFIIPSGSATIELATLLVDHVPGGSNVQQSSVYAEAIKRANHTGTQLLSTISDATEGVQDIAGGMVTGNTETGITVTYQDADGTIDFVVASQTDENFTTADHAKLNGIEASATADQTNAEIRAAVEAATDSNVFTDADHTKLNAIDADVTTLSLPASTTISTFAQTFLDDANAAAVKSTLGIADTGSIAGFVPKSITFPSTSDFLSLATSADLNVGTSDFTLSFWARLDGTGTEPILNKHSGAGYSLKFSSGSLILTIQGTGDPLAVTLATGLNDNKWHVYVVSIDRDGNAVAYVDNNIQTPVAVSDIQSSLDNTTAFRIGYDGANSSNEIAFGNYVVLYKSALDSTQAGKIYFSADTALTVATPTLMVDLRKADKTFTDVSASPLPVITNGTVKFNQDRITSLDGVTIGSTTRASVAGTSVTATSIMGYSTGSGGTTTQPATSGKSTTTTALNKVNGEIVMDDETLAANTTVSFTFTNGVISPTSVVIVNHASVGTLGAYQVTVGAVGTGTCLISVRNVTGSSLSQAIKLNFAVIQAVHS